MKAIILAGGFGKRLGDLTTHTPKPMLEISYKPFICYLFDMLSFFKIDEVILCIHYQRHKFKKYFSTYYNKLKITFSEENKPLGTGGAIKNALKFVENDEPFLILNGDSFLDIDLRVLKNFHVSNNLDLTITIKRMNNCKRYGQIILNNKKISKFLYPGNNAPGYINSGVYITHRQIFNSTTLKSTFSFEKDFLKKSINNVKSMCFKSDDYFVDIGIIEDYRKLCNEHYKLINFKK